LGDTKGIGKPEFIIACHQPGHALPTEKPVKAVTFNIKQCPPGYNGYQYAQN